jgi:hypothetical protein
MSKFETVFDAVKEGTLEDVKYFIEQKGENVNTKHDRMDKTLIEWAFVIGKDNPEVADIIEYLLLKGANIKPFWIFDSITMENDCDSIKITNLFIERGVSVNHRDSGMFPLLFAAGGNNIEVAKFLISKGADIKMVSGNGLTPLQLAKEKGNVEMVEYLKSVEGEKKGCYIATAVYGSYNCPQVWTLRRYRDYALANNILGSIFIRIYYSISPIMVKLFGKTEWFTRLCRNGLDKLVNRLQRRGYINTPYND